MNRNTRLMNYLATFCSFFLVAFVVTFFGAPIIGTHAETETAESQVNLHVGHILAIRTDKNELALEASVGSFVSGSVDVDVSTNSEYGYTLVIEDADSNTSMTSTTTGVTDAITSSFTGGKTSTTMDDNSWGFSVDNKKYYPILPNGSPVILKQTTSSMNNDYDTTRTYFGAKVGMHLTAGTYEDDVLFTAYVNGADGDPIEDVHPVDPDPTVIKYEGEFSYKCSRYAVSPIRTRRLKDGKIWMLTDACWYDLSSSGLNTSVGSTDVGVQTLCPNGFLLPTAKDISDLFEAYGGYMDSTSRYGAGWEDGYINWIKQANNNELRADLELDSVSQRTFWTTTKYTHLANSSRFYTYTLGSGTSHIGYSSPSSSYYFRCYKDPSTISTETQSM